MSSTVKKSVETNCSSLDIIVLGASGDLAKKKIFPALFALFCQNLLPENTKLYGFARSEYSHDTFRKKIMADLTCRYVPGESCAEKMDQFLSSCFYQQGCYDCPDSFLDLYALMAETSNVEKANRIYYYAIPPSLFTSVAKAVGESGLIFREKPGTPWTRTVIEKPFGKDRQSSDELCFELNKIFDESQIYRIDHYLGKEIVQNILVTRFANEIFKPLWQGEHIKNRYHLVRKYRS